MRIRVLDSPPAVARAGADVLARLAVRIESPVLALPTGRTMVPWYAELQRRARRGELDLSRARAFNLDELVLPRDHPMSFYSYMEDHAWEKIGLPKDRCDILEGSADPAAECLRYDRAIAAAGGFDLAILGVGADGHVAYNLSGLAEEATHETTLPTRVAESLGIEARWLPLRALTMGLGPLRHARGLLLMATGRSKSRAIEALREGPRDPRWPCSLLREHPNFDVLLDREAAGGNSS